MDKTAAERVLRSYSGKKLDTRESLHVLRQWALSKGMVEDRWGNFHMEDGHRVKFGKQKMRVEAKSGRRWVLIDSYALIDAAYAAIRDAAKVAGQEGMVEHARTALKSRRSSKKKQKQKRLSKAKQEALETMAVLIASSEDPDLFYAAADDRDSVEAVEFQARRRELLREMEGLEQMGRSVSAAEVFNVDKVPVALLTLKGEATWAEDVDGVTYSVRIEHAERNKAYVEIGASSRGGFQIGVDPLGRSIGYASRSAKGDAYISGYVARRNRGLPVGILFMIVSQHKQRGAGSRVLDLWCDIMAAFGARRWMAKAVGEEGRAFFDARVRDGRLRRIGSLGSDIAFECEGGPRNRQQRLDL